MLRQRNLFSAVAATALMLGMAACSGPQTVENNSTTRAIDRAAGTDVSGAYPTQANGTPGNPPGTEATRAVDRAAGTNTSGAYPMQSDGMPGNPPGTAIGRAVGETR